MSDENPTERLNKVIESLESNKTGFFTTFEEDLATAKNFWGTQGKKVVEVTLDANINSDALFQATANTLMAEGTDLYDFFDAMEHGLGDQIAFVIRVEDGTEGNLEVTKFSDNLRGIFQHSGLAYIAWAKEVDTIPTELKVDGEYLI